MTDGEDDVNDDVPVEGADAPADGQHDQQGEQDRRGQQEEAVVTDEPDRTLRPELQLTSPQAISLGDPRLQAVTDHAADGHLLAFGVSEPGNDAVLFDSLTTAEPDGDVGHGLPVGLVDEGQPQRPAVGLFDLSRKVGDGLTYRGVGDHTLGGPTSTAIAANVPL
ncbi:hypothetical protein IAE22_29280, partial [Bacillus sp. S34]|nr:hypothetical protein [Bacillus sp. S34]